MKKASIKRLFFSFSALSLIALAGCNNNDADSSNEVKEVSQLVEEETVSYTEEITDLEERVTSLYEEAEVIENESLESEVSEETEELDEESNVNLSEEEVSIEEFEAEENLKQDLKKLLDQVEDEEEKNQIQELQKEYGIIETMFNVKKALTDRFNVEKQTVIEESELPSDFMMQLQSLEEIKPVFYEKYREVYESFVAATGLESEQTEEDTNQARIDAIRNLVLNADGSVNTGLSIGELQAYYNELRALDATDNTAAAISAILNNQPEEDLAEEATREDEADTPESRPARPSTATPPRPQAPTRPSSSQPPTTQPPTTQPPTTQPPSTQPPSTQPPTTGAPTPTRPANDPFSPKPEAEPSSDFRLE